jgi:uncharacterized membrane protein
MRFLTAAIVALCLAGVVTASLALREHYNTATSPCSIDEKWDCGAVNHSPYAVFHGAPVALVGILGYALLAALAGRFPVITALGAVVGMGFALRLSWIEWKVLETWCIYCVTSQGIIAAILLLSVVAAIASRRDRRAAS